MFSTLKAIFTFFLKAVLIFTFFTALLVILLKWASPPTSAFMLPGQLEARISDKPAPHYRWIDYRDISPYMPLAVVAAEDQKFPFHKGFDFAAIKKAYQNNQAGKQIRGASTISQQVAKNLFLWPGRSYLRKALEAYFTLLIETLWSKKRILEVYVNVAQMGDNVFGVGAASQSYFKKPARLLEPQEAALLASVLPYPSGFKGGQPSAHLLRRQRWILVQMHALGGAGYLRNI